MIETDEGRRLALNDPRRFGSLDLVRTDALDVGRAVRARWARSRSATDFDGAYLARALDGRTAPIKALLLDQRIVAGLGNIYVCEALQPGADRAGRGPAAISRAPRLDRLADAVKAVLLRGDRGGRLDACATMSGPTASSAISRSEWRVYGREGEPCPRCGAAIRRRVDCGPLDLLLPEMPALTA